MRFRPLAISSAASIAIASSLLLTGQASAGTVVVSNYTGGFTGGIGWGAFIDVSSTVPTIITHINATTTSNPGQSFTVQVYTRSGTALGGSLASGPGSSLDGWTLLGSATGIRGNPPSPTSNAIDIPDIHVGSSVTGVAIVFPDATPRFNQVGSYANFSDGVLTARAGDVRSAPFTSTGTFTTLRSFAGALTYIEGPVAIAGDYNGDGFVDSADYTVWADHFGQSGSSLPGDGNNDGVVDSADYTVWADNFGQGTPPAAAIPEPASLAFAAAPMMLLARRRRA